MSARAIAAVFGAAVRDRLIAHDPTERIKLPEVTRRRVEPLAVAQVEALIVALPERYQVAAVMAAGAGLRQGEVLASRSAMSSS